MITSLFSLIMFDSCLSKVSKKLFDNCFEEFGGRYKTHVMIDLEFCDMDLDILQCLKHPHSMTINYQNSEPLEIEDNISLTLIIGLAL